MDTAVPNSLPAFGFLTVVEDDQHGFFGGYLVLSELGRPLEFHCSTPILPNRAQKILYGITLRSYVLGELIGQTLVNKAQLPVQAVVTDLEEMLDLGLVWDGVLAWLAPVKEDLGDRHSLSSHLAPTFSLAPSVRVAQSSQVAPFVEAEASQVGAPVLDLGQYRLTGSSTCRWSSEKLSEILSPLVSSVDLGEPFQRIHEAIQEAQRVTDHTVGEADENSAAA